MLNERISELRGLAREKEPAILPLLNLAVQVAAMTGNGDYEELFRFHLKGMEAARTDEVLKERPWVYSKFFEDRKKITSALSLLSSAARLNSGLRGAVRTADEARKELARQRAALNGSGSYVEQLKLSTASKAVGMAETTAAEYENILMSIVNRVNDFLIVLDEEIVPPPAVGKATLSLDMSKVFVVHGHDVSLKERVARLCDGLGLSPVILHEQPNKGKTIIEKFEENSDVGFAVVLLTPDDVGGPITSSQSLRPRARQNVVLELGYFIAKLGRSRVTALYVPDVELPSDMQGVLYVEVDPAGAWRMELAKEMRAAGLAVDLNRL